MVTAGRWAVRLREGCGFVQRAAAHPGWIPDTVAGLRHRRRAETRPIRFPLEDYRPFVRPAAAVLAALLDRSERECRDAMADLWLPCTDPAQRDPGWNGSETLMRFAGTAVRLLRPAVVVETGVARGYTTACILAAMRTEGRGHLHSIDLPPLRFRAGRFVGTAVPEYLRARWTLHRGPSRRILGPLVRRVAPVDLFLHDADHAPDAQQREYRTVWPWLRQGGLLISDDVTSPVFLDFARASGARPFLIEQPGKPFPIGVVRRS